MPDGPGTAAVAAAGAARAVSDGQAMELTRVRLESVTPEMLLGLGGEQGPPLSVAVIDQL